MVSFRLAVVLIIRIHLKNRSTGFHSRCLFWFHYVWRHSVLSARKLTWMATSFTPPTRPPQFFSGTDPISLLSVWKYSYPFLDFTSRDGWKNQQARARVGPRFPLARPLVFRRACSARSGVLKNNLSPTDTLALGSAYTFGRQAGQSHVCTFQWSPVI